MNTDAGTQPTDRDAAGKFRRGHGLGGRPRGPRAARCRRTLALARLAALGRGPDGRFIAGHPGVDGAGRPDGLRWFPFGSMPRRIAEAREAEVVASLGDDPAAKAETRAAMDRLIAEAGISVIGGRES